MGITRNNDNRLVYDKRRRINMTITPATLYWFTRLDGINGLCTFVLVFGTLALAFFLIANIVASSNPQDEDSLDIKKVTSKWIKILSFPYVLALLGNIFVPTSKEMAMIYVVPHLAESQVIKQDIPEVYDLGVKALKDWLNKETKGENNE